MLFVDASLDAPAPCSLARIEAVRDDSFTTHAMSPQAVLKVYTDIEDGPPPPAAILAKIGPRPAQHEDMSVPVVEASIAERQKTKKHAEPPAGVALGWGAVRFREIEGEPYWVAAVRYKARTIFGEFPTEALALIRHGKVVKWVYAGTGEPLP